MRRIVAFTVIVTLAAGCTQRQAGGGEDLDACSGYVEYERLAQPAPTDRQEVLTFADTFLRILRRVQLDERVVDRDDKKVPVDEEVVRAYATLERSVKDLRDRVRDADPTQVKAAVAELTDSQAFADADRVIAAFHTGRCSRGRYPTS
jgi:hypothetical protein